MEFYYILKISLKKEITFKQFHFLFFWQFLFFFPIHAFSQQTEVNCISINSLDDSRIRYELQTPLCDSKIDTINGQIQLTTTTRGSVYIFDKDSSWISDSQNFELEINVKKLTGDDFCQYGLILYPLSMNLNADNKIYLEDHSIAIIINNIGEYFVYVSDISSYEPINDSTIIDTVIWGFSPYINIFNSENKFSIIKHGECLYFFINDKFIANSRCRLKISNTIEYFFPKEITLKLQSFSFKSCSDIVYRNDANYFEETFTDNHNKWIEFSSNNGYIMIKDGLLHISKSARWNPFAPPTICPLPNFFRISKEEDFDFKFKCFISKGNIEISLNDSVNACIIIQLSPIRQLVTVVNNTKKPEDIYPIKTKLSDDNNSTTELDEQISDFEIIRIKKCIFIKIHDKDIVCIENISFPLKSITFLQMKKYSSSASVLSYIQFQTLRFSNNNQETLPQIIFKPYCNPDSKGRIYYLQENKVMDFSGFISNETGVKTLIINDRKIKISNTGEFSSILVLKDGKNFVRLILETNDHKIINYDYEILFSEHRTGDGINNFGGRNFLLMIGIDNYKNKILQTPVKDAKDLRDVLCINYRFSINYLIELYNLAATKKNIEDTLLYLSENMGPNDNLIIFFSGHGQYLKQLNVGYWVPYDSINNSFSAWIPNSSILDFISGMAARHILILADACFSGTIVNNLKKFDFSQKSETPAQKLLVNSDSISHISKQSEYYFQIEQPKSRYALSSGRIEPVVGIVGKNSPFVTALISELKNNKNSQISIIEIIDYILKSVPRNSEQIPIGEPLFGCGHEHGQFVFYKR